MINDIQNNYRIGIFRTDNKLTLTIIDNIINRLMKYKKNLTDRWLL